MTLIFISHSSADNVSAREVADWLSSRGFPALFIDFDPVYGIPAGRNWEQEIYARLRQATAVVFVSSAASLESRWCFAELALARAMGLLVVEARIESGARHPLLSDVQGVDVAREGEAALERLAASLKLNGLDPAELFDWDLTRPPYPGLRPFHADEAAVFFGRKTEIEELIERLRSPLRRSSASLALVGPSGSGKSSLVHAGLLPRLSRLPHEWTVLPPIVPDHQPVAALARSLASAAMLPDGSRSWRDLQHRLRHHPSELSEMARDLADGQRLVLLVVDQAEELLNLQGEGVREEFIRIVGAVATEPGPLRLLFSLRSEFLGRLLQQPGMADIIRDSMPIGPLDRSRMAEVITGPARRSGLIFQSELVERMLEDARGGDALPLLAYTLRQLSERAGRSRRLSVTDYEASGGVLGALRRQADRLLEDLTRAGFGHVILPALVKLVTFGEGDEPTRRRLARASLTGAESQVIDAFIDAHLVVSDRLNDEPVVTVAHEALLRVWPPLTGAIDMAREDLRQRAQLERMALDWEHADRQTGYLLSGGRLAVADRWARLNATELALMPLLADFIQASLAWDATARQRAASSIAAQVSDVLLTGDSRLAVSLAVAAIEEYSAVEELVEALREALRQSRVRAVLPGQGVSVTMVAWAGDGRHAAAGMSDGSVRTWDTVTGQQLRAFDGTGVAVLTLSYAADGLVTAGRFAGPYGELGKVRRFSLRTGDETGDSPGVSEETSGPPVAGQAVSQDGGRLARVINYVLDISATSDGARLCRADFSGSLPPFTSDGRPTPSVAWSPDGARVAVAAEDGGVVLSSIDGRVVTALRLEGPVPSAVGHVEPIRSVAFSADGCLVATLFRDGVPRVWDLEEGRKPLDLRGSASMTSLAFAPRGRRLLAGGDDGSSWIWDLADDYDVQPRADGLLYELRGHSGPVTGVAFSPDGTRLVTSSEDGTAILWETGTGNGRRARILRGHQAEVTATAFSPDGARVVTASYDGTMRFWPVDDGEPRIVQGPRNVGRFSAAPPRFTSVAYSSDGRLVVAGFHERVVRFFDAVTGEERPGVRNLNWRVTSVAFSPDGNVAGSAWNSEVTDHWTGEANVYVWQPPSGAGRSLRHRATVFSVGFSPDGSKLATAGADGGARIWDLRSSTSLLAARDYAAVVRSVCFSPDGTRFLTAADDGTARTWDAADGRECFVFAGHSGPVLSAAFGPDSSQVATGGADGTVRVWRETVAEEMLRTAARRGVRLTPAERQRFGLPLRTQPAEPQIP